MQERLTDLLNRVLGWWSGFTSRQKTYIVAIAAGILMAMAILITVLNQTQYTQLVVAKNASEASEIRDLLVDAGIKFDQSSDSTRFSVDKKQYTNALMLMAANNVQTSNWGIENVLGGGFSTTEADKQKAYTKYLEEEIVRRALDIPPVKNAFVTLIRPYNDGTLLSQEKESSATVQITHNGDFTEEMAAVFAKSISVGLGSSTPLNITIVDSNMNMLYSGTEVHSATGGSARTQLATKNAIEKTVGDEVRKVLLSTNLFQKIGVAASIEVDFGSTRVHDLEYYVADGREEGFKGHEDRYDAESQNIGGGIPGTDSNNEGGSYMWPDYPGSSSSESEMSIDYLVSNKLTESDLPPGRPVWSQSSISVTGTRLKFIREEDAAANGDTGQGGPTWEQYKLDNSERTSVPVDPELITFVANASGVPVANISILAFEENVFIDAESRMPAWTDITQIILIVIILGLLAFVVLRSMRSAREEAEEEELNIDKLLQSQPSLEEISVDEGSECKRVIDKFVEENPEAAASLLRNWLNEDWG